MHNFFGKIRIDVDKSYFLAYNLYVKKYDFEFRRNLYMGRLFGTDGVRGIANEELTPELALEIGKAGAYVLT